jgi:hypothetical protein
MSHYASQIQTTAMTLLQAGFGARFRTYRNTPMLQVQPGDLPVLGVYILRERRDSLGDANHAEPKFHHHLTLGISGGVSVATDKQNQLADLEEWMSEVDDILLTDTRFVKLTEGVTGMDRVGQFAKVGETTLYEIRIEMMMDFTSNWPPKVVDLFERLHVTTQYPDAAHVASGTPQIETEYEIEQNS